MQNFIKKFYENVVVKILILIIMVVNLLMFTRYIASKVGIDGKDMQNVYYFFSTASQSISTFIAFLLAGYALVYQAMDNLENRDDTLIDIHHKIKYDYYRKIKWLAVITGIAVITSLVIIWLNGFDIKLRSDLAVISAFFTFLAIIVGLWFVVYIIDPNKIRKAARQIINEKYSARGQVVDEANLIRAFINLERTIRNVILKNDLVGRNQSRRREFISFREMIDILYINELISKEFYTLLSEISGYRNLVVHGHIEQVDDNMVSKTEQALNEMKRIIDDKFGMGE